MAHVDSQVCVDLPLENVYYALVHHEHALCFGTHSYSAHRFTRARIHSANVAGASKHPFQTHATNFIRTHTHTQTQHVMRV